MPKFPLDATKSRAPQSLGFEIVREREHIALQRLNLDGTVTPLTMPNHATIKACATSNSRLCSFPPNRE